MPTSRQTVHFLGLLLAALCAGAAWGVAAPLATPATRPHAVAPARASFLPAMEIQLGLIEHFFQEEQPFRAESEALRFLYGYPNDPRRERVELLRAKLYHRERRYTESRLMLISLLDRFPHGPAAPEARRLLGFSYLHDGLLAEAEPYLPGLGGAGKGETRGASLETLRGDPPGSVSPERAETWSSWLPGGGFFLLSQPAKGWAALGLNLFFTGATLEAAREGLYGAGLIFLLVESALYRGGKQAARDAALAHNTALRNRRAEEWLLEQGEPELLRVGLGLSFSFGGG